MNQRVFICGCENHGKIEKSSVDRLTKYLRDRNIGYTYIEDLCGTILKNPDDLKALMVEYDSLFCGCHPRAMENLICKMGYDNVDTNFYHVDSPELQEVVKTLESDSGDVETIGYEDVWKPWYPVVDYDRCNSCGKCLNFCLFGVYERDDEGRVVVANAANCKDLCPACARVCSENAIIFPKHKDGPIDGSEGSPPDSDQGDILEKIQNEDVYSVLSARRNSFKTSLLKKDQYTLAREERRCCSCGKGKDTNS